MKKFILKTILVCVLAALPFVLYLMVFANGKGDSFLLRFNTPQQQSMILGTSREAQGLQPEVFNQSQADFAHPLYNFSFTASVSPFGPVYYEAIKEKLDPSTQKGIYIVGVIPAAISKRDTNIKDLPKYFREHDSFLDKVEHYNGPYNLDYLVRGYSLQYINLFKNNINPLIELHDDGWLEINVPMDQASIKSRSKRMILKYQRSYYGPYDKSAVRLEYLGKTISLLQQHGRVYLVRLPVGKQMRAIEQWYMPDFDQIMEQVSIQYQLSYYSFNNDSTEYITTDENHLLNTEGRKVSQVLLEKIEEDLAQNPM